MGRLHRLRRLLRRDFQSLALRLARVFLGEQRLQGAVAAGQARPRKQRGAGRVELGMQKTARIEAGGGEIAVAARAEAETRQREEAQTLIPSGHDRRFRCNANLVWSKRFSV